MGRILELISLLESSIPKKYTDNKEAMQMIRDEIERMAMEIRYSEKGQRSGFLDSTKVAGDDYVNTSTTSTFPAYLQNIFNNSGTAKKFLDAVKRGKGPVWDRIALEAIDRLENGYKNHHGYDEPNQDFITITSDMEVPF